MKTGISSAYMSHLAQVQTATFKYLRLLFSVTKAIMCLEVLLEAQLCSWSVTTSDQFAYMWSIAFNCFYFFTWVITLLSHSFFFFAAHERVSSYECSKHPRESSGGFAWNASLLRSTGNEINERAAWLM